MSTTLGPGQPPARPKQDLPAARRIHEDCLPLDRLPPFLAVLGPVVVSGNEVAGGAAGSDGLDLRREVPLGLAPAGPAGRWKSPGIRVVSQKDDHALRTPAGEILPQGQQHRLAGRIGLPGVADEIQAHRDILGPQLPAPGAEGVGGARRRRERPQARRRPICQVCGSPDGFGALSAFDFRAYSRPTATARISQMPASTRFTLAKPVVPSPSMVTPTKTSAADSTSPARQKNESMACLALYFSSRLVGRKSTLRTVFWIE